MPQINTLLELHPDLVVPGRNAFNTVSRLSMLEEWQAKLPQLFALARACYAGNMRFDRHPGVHQREGAATNGGHRR